MSHGRTQVDELGERVLAALTAGETVKVAAARVGLPERTVWNWIRRGRERPDGRFGPFAASAASRRQAAVAARPLPTREELLRRLDQVSRGGGVRATELLLRELGGTADAEPATLNVFARVVELAERRNV